AREPLGAQERLEQSVLIFAITIAVDQDFGSSMGLIAPDSEIDPNVTDACRYKRVQRLDLLLRRFGVTRDVVGLRPQCICGRRARSGQGPIPFADFLPAMERRPGYVGLWMVGSIAGALFFFAFVVYHRGLQLAARPLV